MTGVARPDRWIRGPVADAALALAWMPFALATHMVEGNTSLVRSIVAAVMFLSFAHQPLTLPFVYASPWRLASHRRLFLWTPFVALLVVVLASQLSMALVAVVGGLWNTEHVLMQRYGIARIYGRKAGDDLGRIEKAMLCTWLLIPVLWVVAQGRMQHVITQFGTGTITGSAAGFLTRVPVEARIALPCVALVALYLTGRWVLAQRRVPSGVAPGKWMYLASTAGLFAVAVVDPIAGVVGFVASHSIEYFVIVMRSFGGEARHEGALGRVARAPHGRAWSLALYLAAASAAFVVLYGLAPERVVLVSALTIGAVHFFYDAFIWKLRKPAVAASLVGPAAVRTGGSTAIATSGLASSR